MKKMARIFVLITVTLVLGGCAVGVTHGLDQANPTINAKGGSTIELAVQDKRDFVVTGDKPASFIGLSRGGFGNPFDVNTSSGKPLAADIAKIVQAALLAKGVKVINVEVAPSTPQDKTIELLASTGNKSIFLKIISWKSDTYMQTNLSYNFELLILDGSGKLLASNSISGNEILSGPSWSAKDKVPPVLVNKLEMLFSDPKIASKL